MPEGRFQGGTVASESFTFELPRRAQNPHFPLSLPVGKAVPQSESSAVYATGTTVMTARKIDVTILPVRNLRGSRVEIGRDDKTPQVPYWPTSRMAERSLRKE